MPTSGPMPASGQMPPAGQFAGGGNANPYASGGNANPYAAGVNPYAGGQSAAHMGGPASADFEHVRILSILFYVSAGISAFFALFGLIYVAMGLLVFLTASTNGNTQNGPSPAFMGSIFAGMGVFFLLIGLSVAYAQYRTGRALAAHHSPTLIRVVAAISCLSFPLGTALGVFTLIVMSRPSVKAMFNEYR